MKPVAYRIARVAMWTAILPFIGYAAFTALTFFPILGIFLALDLIPFIYGSGAAPAFLTALLFELVFRSLGRVQAYIWTLPTGALSSFVWTMIIYMVPDLRSDGDVYLFFSVAAAGAAGALIMPLLIVSDSRRMSPLSD